MIEAKWNSPQGTDQLSSQFKTVSARHGSDIEILHVYLTRRSESMFEMLGETQPARGHRLVNLTWMQAFGGHDASFISSGLEAWHKDVVAFLSRLGESPFRGFGAMRLWSTPSAPARFFSSDIEWRLDQERATHPPKFFNAT